MSVVSSASAPVALMSMALLQNQNLGRLGDLALLQLSRRADECDGRNIHGGILLWLSPLSVQPPTFLSRWRCEVHQYRVVMAAKRARFTHSLLSVVTAHQFPLANRPRVSR
jgi:hypothetical protein